MSALRELVEADVPRLVELETELFGPGAWTAGMLTDEIGGPGRWYVGIEDGDGSLVGYAGTWFDGVDAQVMTIGVALGHQGRGVGRQLLEALLAHEDERGAQSVFLEVRVDNAAAIGLYASRGFEQLGIRRGYYQPEGVDALTMRLRLRGGDGPRLGA